MQKLSFVILVTFVMINAAWAGMMPSSDVAWTTQYLGDVMPNAASPAWTQSINWGYQGSHGSVTSDGDILTETTDTLQGVAAFSMGPTNWQGDTDSTVEFRMKVDSVVAGQTYASQMLYGFPRGANADYRWSLNFGTDRVSDSSDAGNGGDYMVDLTQWHTFRVLLYAGTPDLPGGKLELYDLDSPNPAMVLMTDTVPLGVTSYVLEFGDAFSSSIGGSTNWDYVAWTNAGAFAPVPEPTMLTLLAMSSVALLRKRR